MATYSIADIEKLSGVKAHTIRIWEKRYDILPSKRSSTNIRYYDEEDLKIILNIAYLNKHGHKISKIACLSPKEITCKVASYCKVVDENADEIDSLMLSIFELSEHKFLKIVNHKIIDLGFEETMEQTIYPLLDKLSLMWLSNAIKGIHENFVSSIIRRKISVEIDKLDPVFDVDAKKFLIYLPDNEGHELSLLFIYYLLRKKGANVLYLGSQIPLLDVVEGYNIYKPDYIFTLFNDSYSELPLQPYLEDLRLYTPDCHIILSGYQTIKQNLKLDSSFSIINDLNQIKSFVDENVNSMI